MVLLSLFARDTVDDDEVTVKAGSGFLYAMEIVKLFCPANRLVIFRSAVRVTDCLVLSMPNPILDGLNNASIEAAFVTLRRPAPASSTPALAVWSVSDNTTPSAEFTSAD